jgi:hypothetical protein
MTKTLRTATLAALLVGGMSSMALAAECPAMPKAPAVPADGAKATGKEMEAAVKEIETYQDAFKKFNDCAIKEFNVTMDGFNKALDDYQSKNKKK